MLAEETKSLIDEEAGGLKGDTNNKRTRLSLHTKRRKMSRRVNLYGIIGVTCLCILLLIATQHRPMTPAANGTGTMHVQQQQNTIIHSASGVAGMTVFNFTATLNDMLNEQRKVIATEYENFEFPAGRFGVDAEKLEELTPETGGIPVRSIILTTWRSGSTFLGDILNAMPGNFYHYEPLMDFGINQIRTVEESRAPLNNLKNLLNCDFIPMDNYLDFGRTHTYLFEHNIRLWKVCNKYPHVCWRAKFLTPFCKLFPLQSMKTVRLRMALAEELLKDNNLNVRIILLVRDPRGTMQSRNHRDFCPGHPDCDNPTLLCQDLVADYNSAVDLLNKYPSRVRTLRYEDLSLNAYEMTQDILQFYGLPFDPLVEEFLDTHTKQNVGGVSSTFRDSKSAPFHWKTDLKTEAIKHIQDVCTEAMQLWGYRKMENFTDQSGFDPIILPAPFA